MQWEQVKKQVKKKRMLPTKEQKNAPTAVRAFSSCLLASPQVKEHGGKLNFFFDINIDRKTDSQTDRLGTSFTSEHTLQHTATHCNTLQYTATHRNAMQHTATHST